MDERDVSDLWDRNDGSYRTVECVVDCSVLRLLLGSNSPLYINLVKESRLSNTPCRLVIYRYYPAYLPHSQRTQTSMAFYLRMSTCCKVDPYWSHLPTTYLPQPPGTLQYWLVLRIEIRVEYSLKEVLHFWLCKTLKVSK